MEPILHEDGSVQVRLTNGTEVTFVATEPGRRCIVFDDPNGAHISLPATVEDLSALREGAAYSLAAGRLVRVA
jgi:hypothetical protein